MTALRCVSNEEQGERLNFSGRLPAEVEAEIVATLVAKLKTMAAAKLPPRTRYEIRRRLPSKLGLDGVCWFRDPWMDRELYWNSPDKPWVPDEQVYILLERCVT